MKCRIKLRYLIASFVLALSSISTIVFPQNTFAKSIADVQDKYLARGAKICMNTYAKDSIDTESFNSFGALFSSNKQVVGLPAGYISGKDSLNCAELFDKVFDFPEDQNGKAEFLEKVGYKLNDQKQKCAVFQFQKKESVGASSVQNVVSPVLCSENGTNGNKLTVTNSANSPNQDNPESGQGYQFTMSVSDGKINLKGTGGYYGTIPLDASVEYNKSSNWNNIVSSLDSAIKNVVKDKSANDTGNLIYNTTEPVRSIYYNYAGSSDYKYATPSSYKLTDKKAAGNTVAEEIASTIPLSKKETAGLYQNFLYAYYKIDVKGCADKKDKVDKSNIVKETGNPDSEDGYYLTKLYKDDGSSQYCYVEAKQNRGESVYGVTGDLKPRMVADGKIGLKDILDWLANNSPDKIGAELAGSAINTSTAEDQEAAEEAAAAASDKTCMDGAAALGWILCPILDALNSATEWLYESMIAPFLAINADMFNEENGTYQSWQIFQSFANIIFVILLLVVIFSQLTGVGIDNYGIKRILPRLIVAAILINLSYIICQLAVDVSNILGSGLKNLFDSLSSGISANVHDISGASIATTTVLTGIAAGLAGAGAFLASGGIGVILLVVMALLGAVLSLLFTMVLLSARQAVVIILVVVSPVVFVMYMLPNTKKFFDRLVHIFAQMLMLYPICGLLIGGGNFASSVVLAAGNSVTTADFITNFGGIFAPFGAVGDTNLAMAFIFQLSAMLINIIPFFFIPTFVRQSMNALGNIGARISNATMGLTSRAKSATGNAIRNSQAYKNAQEDRNLRNQEKNAQKLINKLKDKENLSSSQKRRLGRAYSTVNKIRSDTIGGLAAARDAYENFNEDAAMEASQKASEKSRLAEYTDFYKRETNGGAQLNKLFSGEGNNATGEWVDQLNNYKAAKASGNNLAMNEAKMRMLAMVDVAGASKFQAKDFAKFIKGQNFDADDREIMQSISKQMTTGNGSKNYRAADAAAFEWADQINKGQDASGNKISSEELSFKNWAKDSAHIDSAIEHHITDAGELYSQANGAIDPSKENSLYAMAGASGREMLNSVAQQAITERGLQSGDATKFASVARLAGTDGKSSFAENHKYEDYNDMIAKRASADGSGPVSGQGDAKENQNFQVHDTSGFSGSTGSAASAGNPIGDSANAYQQMIDNDAELDIRQPKPQNTSTDNFQDRLNTLNSAKKEYISLGSGSNQFNGVKPPKDFVASSGYQKDSGGNHIVRGNWQGREVTWNASTGTMTQL